MNVRIVPRGQPGVTYLYGGVTRIHSDGQTLLLVDGPITMGKCPVQLRMRDVAEILLDEEPGDWF